MKSKKTLLKKIFTVIICTNSLLIAAQEFKQPNDAVNIVWSNQDYVAFSEKAIYDCYKLKANKSRLYDRIDLLLKNNKIDENKYNEYKKRIEIEEDILVKNYKDEIASEISEMEKFCKTNIANLSYTPQEKKIEYIILKIQEDFLFRAQYEKKYLETNHIDKPKSAPNMGIQYAEWTIDDYNNFLKGDSENCAKNTIFQTSTKKYNLDVEIGLLKSKKYNKEINENKFNLLVNELQTNYDNEIKNLEIKCAELLAKNIKYRDEWVNYLKIKQTEQENERVEINAKIEKEKIETKAREALDKIEQEKKNKIEEELFAAKTKEILNSVEYKNWKTKFLSIFNSAKANAVIIDNLENKYSFRNNFGNKVWDPSSFSKQDKIIYNKNYDAIGKKLDDMKELQKIGRNEYFESLYGHLAGTQTSAGLEIYNLAQYYNHHEKLY